MEEQTKEANYSGYVLVIQQDPVIVRNCLRNLTNFLCHFRIRATEKGVALLSDEFKIGEKKFDNETDSTVLAVSSSLDSFKALFGMVHLSEDVLQFEFFPGRGPQLFNAVRSFGFINNSFTGYINMKVETSATFISITEVDYDISVSHSNEFSVSAEGSIGKVAGSGNLGVTFGGKKTEGTKISTKLEKKYAAAVYLKCPPGKILRYRIMVAMDKQDNGKFKVTVAINSKVDAHCHYGNSNVAKKVRMPFELLDIFLKKGAFGLNYNNKTVRYVDDTIQLEREGNYTTDESLGLWVETEDVKEIKQNPKCKAYKDILTPENGEQPPEESVEIT